MKKLKVLKVLAPILFSFFIIGFFIYTKIAIVKLYPIVINFLFFSIFFASLFAKETVIQKIARCMDGKLEEPVFSYTKRLTYIWVIFLFANFLISCVTLFMPNKFWVLYNGCISYILVGTLFFVEYIVRYFFKKRHGI